MEKEQFDDICSRLNIDEITKRNAIQQFEEISRNTILDGNPQEWFCCALWSSCNKSLVPTVGNALIQGNGVSLAKLIQVCNLSIFSFFEKIDTWFKVSSVPSAMQQKIENIKRSFSLSKLVYNDFSTKFAKLFKCCSDIGDEPKLMKSRRKSKNTPYTSQKLFEMCWSLFVAAKAESTDKSVDTVTSINLLLCCLDLMFTNVINDNRRDLINPSFAGLPEGFFSPSWDEKRAPSINVIDKLSCDQQSSAEVSKFRNTRFEIIIRRLFSEKGLAGNSKSFTSADNFEVNFKKLNSLYEIYVLNYGQFDERVFLSHPEIGSKFFGRSLTVGSSGSQDRHDGSQSNLMPQTPLSGQDLSHPTNSKLSPISSYKQNVQKLQALYNGQRGPTNTLQELLLVSCPGNILESLRQRLSKMETVFEKFCSKTMKNGQDRFQYAEALYYRLLESIIKFEVKAHGRFDLFIDDDVFNQALIVLCLEIVLFAFSLHKELTMLLECFELEPFHFYKLIEVAIRNNKDFFTNDIIKHLKAIEEQCLDSLAWTSGSVLWEKIKEHRGKLPTNQEVDLPLSQGSSQGSPNSQQTPKSLRLFFRKFYQLAHLRLKDLCKNLQFSNNPENLLQMIWTLFEHAIIEHTGLMKDRHVDQILMCCVYVLCKIRSNENSHTFADIMKFYRNQPQADSHIYRSVFIEYVQASDKAGEKDQNGRKNSAAEPEVVSGRNTIYGTESRGDIIYFYNKIFVPKMQQFAMRFSTSSSQNNLLLSPLPCARPLISPRKISALHEVYVQTLTKQNILSPSARTLTFTIEQSPSKDLQRINSLINQSRKLIVTKRLNIDSESEYPTKKVAKDSSIQLLISDREEFSN